MELSYISMDTLEGQSVSTSKSSWAIPPQSGLLCEDDAREIDQVIREPQERRRRTRPGQTLRRFDAGWYVFDGLNEDQAVELLSLHGHDGTYLVINNSGSSTWSFVVRQSDDEGISCHKHVVKRHKKDYVIEGMKGRHRSLNEVEDHLGWHYRNQGTHLMALFHENDEKTLTLSVRCPPPDYSVAQRYPNAPAKALPSVHCADSLKPSPLPSSYTPVSTTRPAQRSRRSQNCCQLL